jgi:hypothetical protein
MEMTNGMQLTYSNYSNLNLGGERKEIHKKKKKCETCRQGGFWEDSFPSASVNARQKSSIKFAIVDQVPGIIKSTSYHRVLRSRWMWIKCFYRDISIAITIL